MTSTASAPTTPKAEKEKIETSPVGSHSTAGGFTLLELLVVLVILGVITAVAAPLATGGVGRAGAKAAAGEVAALMREARSEAVAGNRDVLVTVDVADHVIGIGSRPTKSLPKTLQLALFTAESEQIDADAGRIRFFPDGSATGGELRLAAGEDEYRVQVEWLTGRVSIIEASAL